MIRWAPFPLSALRRRADPRIAQIIVRARHSHLLTAYLATSAHTLGPALLADVQAAWSAYVFKTLAPALPADTTADKSFAAAQALWRSVQANEMADVAWADAQRAREEKWTMYLAAVKGGLDGIESGEAALKAGYTAAEAATALVESNRDAVGIWLDKQVRPGALRDREGALTLPMFAAWRDCHRPRRFSQPRRLLGRLVLQVDGRAAR